MSLMKKKSIQQNYIYNLIYQIFALITPLITAPYVSRVLGSDGVGQYSFVSSITSYFVLLGNLGFTYHSLRELAGLQGNKEEQSKAFWEIFFARLICVLIVLLIFILTIKMNLYGRYTGLMAIMCIQIFSIAFDVSFLFQANDIFDIIAIRTILVKCFAVAMIFLFVKDENELWICVLCQCLINVVSNLTLWTKVPLIVSKVKFKELNIFKHFKPSIILFIPQIAISIYNVLDRTLIGILVKGQVTEYVDGKLVVKMVSDIENGCYEQSQKIVTMAMTVFTALSTVLISRNSTEIATGNFEQLKKNLYGAIDYLIFIGAPIAFGLAGIARNFSPWFFGDGYDKTPGLIIIFSPFVVVVGLSNILGRQYLNPAKRDKEFTYAIFIGAITNLILNLCLIPTYASYGAAVASLIAETMVTTVMAIMVKKEINVLKRIRRAWKIWLSSLTMFIVVTVAQMKLQPNILNTMLLVFTGVIVYFLMLFILREEYLFKAFSILKVKLTHKN